MSNLNTHNNQSTHEDSSIQAEIWDKLWKRWEIRALDISSFSVSVKNGRVLLRGHLTMDNNRRLIESICETIPGVVGVDNCLVIDHDLTMQVAQALAQDGRTRSLILPVGSYHGWVGIGGHVPNRSLQLAAQEVAAGVSSVRGVISLPSVIGQDSLPQLHPGKGATTAAGWLGELHPTLLEGEWGVFELDLSTLFEPIPERIEYVDVITFPAVRQDIAVVVGEDVEAGAIRDAVLEAGGEEVREAEIFDVYRGEQAGAGRKSVAIHLAFQSPERTMSDDDAAAIRERILAVLSARFDAELRG